MPRFKVKGTLERSAPADLFKHTLSKIPSVFGKVAYLSSLRDPNSGNYRHHGLAASFGREESAKALKDSHETYFNEWLSMPISAKHQDLKEYLRGVDESPALVLHHWKKTALLTLFTPASVRPAARALFLQEMDTLVRLLSSGDGVGQPDRGSSQPA